MGMPDPYAILRVSRSASLKQIEAAFRARAKESHPDMQGNGVRAEFEAVHNAWNIIQHERKTGWQQQYKAEFAGEISRTKQSEDTETDEDQLTATEVVKGYLKRERLIVRFDGDLNQRGDIVAPTTLEEIQKALEQPHLTYNSLYSKLILHVSKNKLKISALVLNAALSTVIEEAQMRRKSEVLMPLYVPLTQEEVLEAEAHWQKLAEVFTSPNALTIAVLKKMIYQVKRKSAKLPVERHLMPVIQNKIQGGGKTSFVNRFLEPVQELQSGPTLFDDYIDRRSGDLYNFPVVFIDDIAKVKPDDLPILNGVITGESIQRRKLGTSRTVRVRQNSTLIGTCNKELAQLITDETGNRRFAVLQFRSGAVEKGGDPQVWRIINSTDFRLLWRSVDALGADPILPELEHLERWQGYHRRRSDLEQWLADLDVASYEFLSIREGRGIKVSVLWELYLEQTGEEITLSKFGTEIGHLIAKKIGPFKKKEKLVGGKYCVL